MNTCSGDARESLGGDVSTASPVGVRELISGEITSD